MKQSVYRQYLHFAATIYIMKLSSFALFKMLYDIPTTFLIKCSKHDPGKYFNPSHPSVTFYIVT